MSSRDTVTGLAIGALVGAAVGLAIGFLYAPRSGAETRELLREKAEKVKEAAAEAKEKVRA